MYVSRENSVRAVLGRINDYDRILDSVLSLSAADIRPELFYMRSMTVSWFF